MNNEMSWSWSWSSSRLVVALAISVGLAIGAGGCVGAPDEPVASELEAPAVEATVQASTGAGLASFQVVYQCFGPDGRLIGLPKSPRAACLAACPAGGVCVRCVFQNNAVECD